MRILFLVRSSTISCCVVASLIESGFRIAIFSDFIPFSKLIIVFLSVAYSSCCCCFSSFSFLVALVFVVSRASFVIF